MSAPPPRNPPPPATRNIVGVAEHIEHIINSMHNIFIFSSSLSQDVESTDGIGKTYREGTAASKFGNLLKRDTHDILYRVSYEMQF